MPQLDIQASKYFNSINTLLDSEVTLFDHRIVDLNFKFNPHSDHDLDLVKVRALIDTFEKGTDRLEAALNGLLLNLLAKGEGLKQRSVLLGEGDGCTAFREKIVQHLSDLDEFVTLANRIAETMCGHFDKLTADENLRHLPMVERQRLESHEHRLREFLVAKLEQIAEAEAEFLAMQHLYAPPKDEYRLPALSLADLTSPQALKKVLLA